MPGKQSACNLSLQTECVSFLSDSLFQTNMPYLNGVCVAWRPRLRPALDSGFTPPHGSPSGGSSTRCRSSSSGTSWGCIGIGCLHRGVGLLLSYRRCWRLLGSRSSAARPEPNTATNDMEDVFSAIGHHLDLFYISICLSSQVFQCMDQITPTVGIVYFHMQAFAEGHAHPWMLTFDRYFGRQGISQEDRRQCPAPCGYVLPKPAQHWPIKRLRCQTAPSPL